MKKNINVFLSSLLAIVFVTSFVIAVAGISISPATLDFRIEDTTKTFTIANTGDEDIDISLPATKTITQGSNTVTFTFTPNSFNDVTNVSAPVTVDVTLSGSSTAFKFGKYSPSTPTTITATESDGGGSVTTPLTLQFTRGFCSNGQKGTANMTISDIDVDNKGDSEDSDDDVWVLGDEVEISVDVENLLPNDDLNDINVKMGLFDSQGNDVADDLDFDSPDEEEQEVGDINEDDEETITFSFRVPPDFDVGDYTLVFKAFEDGKENSLCAERDEGAIDVDQESDEGRFVIVDEILMDNQVTCGDTVSGRFTVFNIGDESQDRVLITMKNTELGVDQRFEITKDFDEGDDQTFDFTFPVPSNAKNKLYPIEFTTEYDYRNGVYREISEDNFIGFVTVIGCAGTGEGPITPPTTDKGLEISASLDSDAKLGEELVVIATFTNTGTKLMTVSIDAEAFESWAELGSVSPKTLSLTAGESKTSTFKFNVKEDAEKTQSFIISAVYDGKIAVQEVEVNLEEGTAGSGGITGFAGLDLGGNNLIWVIVIVNVILLILIIIVAVRLSRR